MTTLLLQPAFWGALVVGLCLAAVFVSSATSDISRSRADRHARVVASFAGLRLTPSHLIVGTRTGAEQISLTGLAVAVKQIESANGPDVVVTIRGGGQVIERRESLSYGAGGQAQIFAIMFNRMARATYPVAAATPIAAATSIAA